MTDDRATWEDRLNDFNPKARSQALDALLDLVQRGDIELPETSNAVNLHIHTFFSFNGYGYSPTCVAWKARCAGLAAAAAIDFDVLDATDEFRAACRKVGVRACTGFESRTYVEEFSEYEMNSPGEPGVAYHIGVGFTSTRPEPLGMLPELKATAQARNRGILERVNPYLKPLDLDYENDVLPLTPGGNPTERHLCMAYDAKGRERFRNEDERAAFWAERLGAPPEDIKAMFADPPVFQGFLRSKTMKAGGVGYVKPEGPDFPPIADVNAFILDAGAIPTFGWLDGLSSGERRIEELLDFMMSGGTAALNIIPDRNWNLKDPGDKKTKVAELHKIVRLAQERDLPIVVGTEMNAYGQRFVDDFSAPEMAPLVEPALEGAYILHAHTLLQDRHGAGYLSDWAKGNFDSAAAKNAFFAEVGRIVGPQDENLLDAVSPSQSPQEMLAALAP